MIIITPELQTFITEHIKVRPDVFSCKFPKEYNQILSITSFLANDVPLRQRFYHILYNELSTLKCKCCTIVDVKWNPSKREYRQYCSKKCTANSSDVRKQTIQTNQLKYGGNAPSASIKVKQKIQLTNLERYGVQNPMQNEAVQQKKIDTNLERYGTDNPSKLKDVKSKIKSAVSNNWKINHSDILKRTQATNLERYGVQNPMQNDVVQQKKIDTNLERYGVQNPMKSVDVQQKLKQTMVERYGSESYTVSLLSEYCKEKIKDKSWLIQQHHTEQRTITDIAVELNIDVSSLSRYFQKYNIELRKFSRSQGEREIATFLDSIGVEYIINTKQIITPYELDIFIPQFNIAIEYCGLYWHSDIHPRITNSYHLTKLELCEAKGIQLITIFEDEWFEKSILMKNKLLHSFNMISANIFARKCNVCYDVPLFEKQEFFDKHHIQGSGPGSITLKLEYEGIAVAMCTFIKKKNTYILNRYATSDRVVGGFSKLLSAFIKLYNPNKIITFADRRFSTGQLYKATGFVLTSTTAPDYRYIVKNKRVHKFNFRHIYLQHKLENYDKSLSEVQNMKAHGFSRIFDCGLYKFEYTVK